MRAGRRDDLDAIEDIEIEAFDADLLSRRALRRALVIATTETRVATLDDRPVGYAMIAFRRGSAIGRVFTLAVVREAARRGVGAALLEACEDAAWARGSTRVRLEVRDDNRPAIALYERAGYACFDRVTDYYEDGGAALRFEKRRQDGD